MDPTWIYCNEIRRTTKAEPVWEDSSLLAGRQMLRMRRLPPAVKYRYLEARSIDSAAIAAATSSKALPGGKSRSCLFAPKMDH
jgi:hypothetical protein